MGLDLVEIVLHLEEQFGVELPDSEAERLRTPGKLVDFITAQLPSTDRASKRAEVAQRVKAIIVKQLALDEDEYSEDADLIRDLGAN